MRLLMLLLISLSANVSFAQPSQGQQRLDSLLREIPKMKEDTNAAKVMRQISSIYWYVNPDQGLKWGYRSLALAKKLGSRKAEGGAYNVIGNNYFYKGDYPKALELMLQALSIAEETGDKKLAFIANGNIGNIYHGLKNYSASLSYHLKALELAEESNNVNGMPTVLASIGTAYDGLNDTVNTLRYFQKALAAAEKNGDDLWIGMTSGNIGVIYDDQKKYNLALQYKFKSMRIGEIDGNMQLVGVQLGSIGQTYFGIASDSTKDPIADSLVPASRSGNFAKAKYYLTEGIALLRKAQYFENIPGFYDDLSSVLIAQGDYKGAIAAYKQAVVIQDSLDIKADKEKITRLETSRALQLKDKDIQIAKLAVAKKRNERGFFIAGIVSLLLIMGIIVYNFRRHERSRRHIKALQDHKISLLDEAVKRRTEQLGSMRQTIATDFHDQTGNMLAAITRQAATLELKLLQQPDVLPLVRTIINNSNELYASSKDFLWNLNHDSDDPLVLFQYLSGYGQRFYNQFDIAFSSHIKGEEQPHMQLHPFAGLNLIYIFKEAMSNVIKHSGADEVSIELYWQADKVTYSLQDNGTWKEADITVEHYGLRNMERRCKQSGFDYELSHNPQGTVVNVTLPINTGFVSITTP